MTSFHYGDRLTQELWDQASSPLRIMYLKISKIYALFVRDDNSVYIDGACGISCVLEIIRACGYKTQTCSDKRGRTESFLVWKE